MVGKPGSLLDKEAGFSLNNNEGHRISPLVLIPWLLFDPLLSNPPALTMAAHLPHRALSPWVLKMLPLPLLGILRWIPQFQVSETWTFSGLTLLSELNHSLYNFFPFCALNFMDILLNTDFFHSLLVFPVIWTSTTKLASLLALYQELSKFKAALVFLPNLLHLRYFSSVA